MIEKIKSLEIYKNAISKDVSEEYQGWQYDLDTTTIVELVKELEQLTLTSVGCSVWMVQDQVTLVVHGMFTTQAKAINYANGSNRMAITNLTLG